ncbi:MAG: hypothetical protein OXG08_04235 [Gammaproteobacteria bacterium]|nr:hypothetical protein [Gammaproteobacteria bacterium]
MTTSEESRDNEALVAFLQALALTIVKFMDEIPENQRTSENFLLCLDGLLDEILSMDEREGSQEIYKSVLVLRQNLDKAIMQVRRYRPSDKTLH